MKLDYLTPEQAFPNSVSVFDSDLGINLVLMEQIVGTLVKYGISGQPEPYLAKKWKYSPEDYSWTFYLRNNLMTEDGIQINAKNYIKSFLTVFKELIKESNPPVLKKIVGYENFKNGSTILEGLSEVDEYTIEFKFLTKTSGLLEFLSMPYYGFYSLENFDKNKKWKSNKHIFSSGAYKIKSWNSSLIILEKRNEWALNSNQSPKTIKITQQKHEINKIKNPTIITITDKNSFNKKIEDNFYNFQSVPTYLQALVLSTKKNKVLQNINVRKYIQHELYRESSFVKLNISSARKTNTFYHSQKKINIINKARQIPKELLEKELMLDIVTTEPKDSETFNYISELLQNIFASTKVKLVWIHLDKSKPNWHQKLLSNKNYDIRLAHVNSGSYPINWAVEMMFCSKLGISFPDYSGKICKLVKEYETDNISKEKYLLKFENTIFDDAVVIPFLHRAKQWQITNNIDSSTLDPTSGIIRFDLLRTK